MKMVTDAMQATVGKMEIVSVLKCFGEDHVHSYFYCKAKGGKKINKNHINERWIRRSQRNRQPMSKDTYLSETLLLGVWEEYRGVCILQLDIYDLSGPYHILANSSITNLVNVL